MSFLFDLVKNAFLGMLQLLWFGKRKISNSLSIYIKTNTGSTLSVELDPKWDIKNLKKIVAPQMGIAPEDIKIIFAGKELHNSTIIEVSLLRIYAKLFFSVRNYNIKYI
jgi:parkin